MEKCSTIDVFDSPTLNYSSQAVKHLEAYGQFYG